jgi:hypothetical protein
MISAANTKSGQPLSGLIPKEDSSTTIPPTVSPVTSEIRAEMEHLVEEPTTGGNAYNDTPEYRASLEKIVQEPIKPKPVNHSHGSSHDLGSLDFYKRAGKLMDEKTGLWLMPALTTLGSIVSTLVIDKVFNKAEKPEKNENNDPYALAGALTVNRLPKMFRLANAFMHVNDLWLAAAHGGWKGEGITGKWAVKPKADVHLESQDLDPNLQKMRNTFAEKNSEGHAIYKGSYDHSPIRTYGVDVVSMAGCAWDGLNTFLDTLSKEKSFGKALVGGASTFFNTIFFGFHVAEKIMYPVIEQVMKLPFIPAEIKEKGWAVTALGGSGSLLAIEGIIRGWEALVTPNLAKIIGPIIDKALGQKPKPEKA